MKYECRDEKARSKDEGKWNAELLIIRANKDFCEMRVTGRGSLFHVIFRAGAGNGFLCIPNWDVGCEIVTHDDVFWNLEKLSKQMRRVDAITVVYAIKNAVSYIKETMS